MMVINGTVEEYGYETFEQQVARMKTLSN